MGNLLTVFTIMAIICFVDYRKVFYEKQKMALHIFYIAAIGFSALLFGLHCWGIDLHSLIYQN